MNYHLPDDQVAFSVVYYVCRYGFIRIAGNRT